MIINVRCANKLGPINNRRPIILFTGYARTKVARKMAVYTIIAFGLAPLSIEVILSFSRAKPVFEKTERKIRCRIRKKH